MKDSRSAKYLNSSSVKPVNPPNRLRRSGSRVASPDLPSESGIVVNNANLHTALCGTSSRGQARRGRRRLPAPQIGSLFSVRCASVFISMPGLHNTWQVRQYSLPSTAARHSKQIPMPHNGPRNSPLTDFRQAAPASAMATATVAPEGTTTVVILLAMYFRHLLLVGRHPNGSTLFVLDIRGQCGAQFLPELLRVTSKSELRLRIIHHHDVSHAGGSRSPANHVAIHNRDPHAFPDTFIRASAPTMPAPTTTASSVAALTPAGLTLAPLTTESPY